jgi:RNA polymerase sigma-70 factor (ECF subfamily)
VKGAGADLPLAEPDAAGETAAPPPHAAALFRTVFETELDYVWNALRQLGVPDRDLEDVAHDVFVTVLRRIDDYDRARPVRPWLFGIAYRTAADYRKRAYVRRERIGDVPDRDDGAAPADERLAAAEAQRTVALALEALPFERRAVFVMHDVDGHPMPEVAATLAVPLNTAYTRLRAAREEFHAAVRRVQFRRGER